MMDYTSIILTVVFEQQNQQSFSLHQPTQLQKKLHVFPMNQLCRFAANPTLDHFVMCVIQLIPIDKKFVCI